MTTGGSDRDTVFSQRLNEITGFCFDQKVVAVFDDMISRSVPGYDHLVFMSGVLSRIFTRPSARIYDLGCSLGKVTESIIKNNLDKGLHYVCVDNSYHMMERCKLRLQGKYPEQHLDFRKTDISNIKLTGASLVIANFTLQFIEVKQRQVILQKIYDGLTPGGALILSEKIAIPETSHEQKIIAMHEQFKRVNGYSHLEISQKRTALEQVMHPDSVDQHYHRLSEVGFDITIQWFQSLNFVSFLAIK